MQMNTLGRTGMRVSRICLGTMTFGEQNTEDEGHAQIDMAADHGVNFLDSAEMYSFPACAETYGRSEEIIGSWLKKPGNRDRMIVATKMVGPGPRFSHIREGDLTFSRGNIKRAVEASLKRLQTDVIDLYQTHWPERPVNKFGLLDHPYREPEGDWVPFEEVLDAMDEQVKAGNIRAYGVSNESPWGVMKMLQLADSKNLPRVASIQNAYSLINRMFEVGLSEVALREDCGLLAYSPLSFGALSGKYLDGNLPQGSRHRLFPDFMRYFHERAEKATERYVNLAREHSLDPVEMALVYVTTRPFVTSNIIGATTLEQLKTNLNSENLELGEEVLNGIEAIHKAHANPAP
jgi:aryl-alcohol dehydrogenase-like predicted oxidoreductase